MENLVQQPNERLRTAGFLSFLTLTALLFWPTIHAVLLLSLSDERYSHIILIPLISPCLIYWRRNAVFRNVQYQLTSGIPFLLLGFLLYLFSTYWVLYPNRNIALSIAVLGITTTWIAGFLLVFGLKSFRLAMFPLFFLLLMIPVPTFLLASAVSGLQQGSAIITAILFRLLGVPIVRHGLTFSLPGVDIEIAEQCSGIRSSLSLFITGVLASYLLLQSAWKRTLFSLLTIPIAIVKNAVRIASLSWLGVYVNPGFFHGKLHHYGGLPVSLLALAILAPIIFALRKSESGLRSPTKHAPPLVLAG